MDQTSATLWELISLASCLCAAAFAEWERKSRSEQSSWCLPHSVFSLSLHSPALHQNPFLTLLSSSIQSAPSKSPTALWETRELGSPLKRFHSGWSSVAQVSLLFPPLYFHLKRKVKLPIFTLSKLLSTVCEPVTLPTKRRATLPFPVFIRKLSQQGCLIEVAWWKLASPWNVGVVWQQWIRPTCGSWYMDFN